ncbi:hypothetical protein CDD83_10 [Cordyceps sp. RAO-2017]|nr:hypothetical protein CDD83_10 [Cordyceps sp. RAO-2017]
MHRVAESRLLSASEKEQRFRVFWIAFSFDVHTSTRSGRPCMQNANDIGIDLPSASPRDNLGILVNSNGSAVLNFLSAKAQFSVLHGKVYDRLFTTSAVEKSKTVLDGDIQELGEELQRLGRLIPGISAGTQEPHRIISSNWNHEQHRHLLSLLLGFHSCAMTVYSASWHHHLHLIKARGPTKADLAVAFPHFDRCVQAAYEIVDLLSLISRNETSFIW